MADVTTDGTAPTFFEKTAIGWDIAFWVLLATALLSALTSDLDQGQTILSVSILAALGLAYTLVGRQAMRTRATVARHVYLVVLVLSCAGLFAIAPTTSFLLFIAFPQIWTHSEKMASAVVYTVTLVCALILAELIGNGFTVEVLLDNLPWMLVSLAVSFVLGVWITKVIEESQARQELIDTLERTRAELAEAHHAAGVVAERERLAAEIHDTLAQGYTGIITLAGAAQAMVARGDLEQAIARLATIEDIARDNLGEARALVAAFSPLGIDDSTLVEALHRLATRFESETGVKVLVRIKTQAAHDAMLPASHQVVLLRIAQEALANVRKHAAATSVGIELSTDADGRAAIEVTDNGSGFEPAQMTHSGYGLAGMRGRVEDVGGQLEIDSVPGAGTLIRVLLPGSAPGPAQVAT